MSKNSAQRFFEEEAMSIQLCNIKKIMESIMSLKYFHRKCTNDINTGKLR